MNNLVDYLINPYTMAYGIILVTTQLLYRQWWQKKRDRIATQRLTRGLPSAPLPLSYSDRHSQRRRAALVEITLLTTTLLVVPILLIGIARRVESTEQSTLTHQNGLALFLMGLLLLTWLSGLPATKAFVSGLAYKIITAFTLPFQLGDYITVQGTSGRVADLNTFFVTIQTLSGQRVSLPTHTLWREAITIEPHSAHQNQGALCEMCFYLSPVTTTEQTRIVENTLLEAARSSAYIEPSQPIDLYFAQSLTAITLTLSVYATAPEHSVAFRSDITRQFLAIAHHKQIPLASIHTSSSS